MIPPIMAASAASAAVGAAKSFASALASGDESAPTPGSGAPGTTGGTRRNDTLGKTEFLSLLVAQLQNQDPLNPLDSADFSAQLAQFSGLEQLMQINDKLTELGNDDGAPQAFDPVGLLGRDITANGAAVHVATGEATMLEYTLADAGKVTVEVRSGSGNLIGTAEIGQTAAGTHVLDLDELAPFADLGDGDYTVSVKIQSGDAAPSTVATRITGTVTGVDLTTDPPTIRIGDLEISLGDVREVRAAAATATA